MVVTKPLKLRLAATMNAGPGVSVAAQLGWLKSRVVVSTCVRTQICGALCGKHGRGFMAAMLFSAIGFLSGKNCGHSLQSSLLKSMSKSAVMKAWEVHSVGKGIWGTQQ